MYLKSLNGETYRFKSVNQIHCGNMSLPCYTNRLDVMFWTECNSQCDCAELTHAVVVVRELEAGEAQTVVGAHGVLTGAVSTRLPVALVNICRTQ